MRKSLILVTTFLNVSEKSLTASPEYLPSPTQFANLLSTGRQTLQQLSTPQQRKKRVNCVKEPPEGKMHILRLPLVEKTQLTSLYQKSTRCWTHLCGHSVHTRLSAYLHIRWIYLTIELDIYWILHWYKLNANVHKHTNL